METIKLAQNVDSLQQELNNKIKELRRVSSSHDELESLLEKEREEKEKLNKQVTVCTCTCIKWR